MVETQSFGTALKFHRKQAGLTQQALALATGYSREHIAHLEGGRRLPDVTTVAALFLPALNLTHDQDKAEKLLQLATRAHGLSLRQSNIEIQTKSEPRSDASPEPKPAALTEAADTVADTFDWFIKVDPEAALKLANNIAPMWAMQGKYKQARAWLREILAHSTSPTVSRGMALEHAARFARAQCDWDESLELAQQAQAIFEQADDLYGVTRIMMLRSWNHFDQQQKAQALACMTDALEHARAHRLENLEVEALTALCHVRLFEVVDAETAQPVLALLDEAEALCHKLNLPMTVAYVHQQRGLLFERIDALEQALEQQVLSHDRFANSGDQISAAWAKSALCDLHRRLGNLADAVRWGQKALAVFDAASEQLGSTAAHHNLGRAFQSIGKMSDALSHFQACLGVAQRIRHQHFIGHGLAGVGAVWAAHANAATRQTGVQLLAAADALFNSLPRFLSDEQQAHYQAIHTQARFVLDAALFAAAWQRGQTMSSEQAIALALAPPLTH